MSANRLSAHEIASEASPHLLEAPKGNENARQKVSNEMHHSVQKMIGPQMSEAPSYSEARADAGHREDVASHSPREDAVRTSEALVSTSAERVPTHYHMDVKKEAKAALGFGTIGALAVGAPLATVAGLSAASLGASAMATGVASASALVAGGLYGGLAAAGLYTGGLLHNVFWNRGGDGARPGVMGTLMRGIVSPFTVPAGLMYSLVKK